MTGYRLSLLFLLVISVFSIVLLIMIFWPIEIITPNIQPYKIINHQVRQGESLIYQVDACKYYDLVSMVRRQIIIDGVVYDLPLTQNNVQKGCGKTDVAVFISPALPTGHAYIELTIQYKVNALRDETYYFKTEGFDILQQQDKKL